MPDHFWGSWPDFMFNHVENAAYEIGQYCRKWGRIGVSQTKEKHGTARVYCSFGIYSFHDLTHPGYAYSQYPKFFWRLNNSLSYSKVGTFLFGLVNKLLVPYQIWIYRRAYERAFKKYPLIKKEIVEGADWPEFISEYWKSIPLCNKHNEYSTGWTRMGSGCIMCNEENKYGSEKKANS